MYLTVLLYVERANLLHTCKLDQLPASRGFEEYKTRSKFSAETALDLRGSKRTYITLLITDNEKIPAGSLEEHL